MLTSYMSVLGLEDTPRSQQAGEMGQSPEPGNVELSFEVEDAVAALRELQAARVGNLSGLQTQPFGSMFDARDPDGYRLNFYRLSGRNRY